MWKQTFVHLRHRVRGDESFASRLSCSCYRGARSWQWWRRRRATISVASSSATIGQSATIQSTGRVRGGGRGKPIKSPTSVVRLSIESISDVPSLERYQQRHERDRRLFLLAPLGGPHLLYDYSLYICISLLLSLSAPTLAPASSSVLSGFNRDILLVVGINTGRRSG